MCLGSSFHVGLLVIMLVQNQNNRSINIGIVEVKICLLPFTGLTD